MQKSSGYYLNRKGFYVIDKQYLSQRIFETTCYGEGEAREVEARVRELCTDIYNAKKRGDRPVVTFRDCAIEYCVRNQHQNQIVEFESLMGRLDPYVGHVNADQLHSDHESIVRLTSDLLSKGRKNLTVNAYLEAIGRVLRAATQWRYSWCDLTWLAVAPVFDMLEKDSRPPRPLSWKAQKQLLAELPKHLQGEVETFVNTGMRDNELNTLRWGNELVLPGNVMAFIVKAKGSTRQKKRERLVIFNHKAAAIVEGRRGEHEEYVFVYRGKPKAKTNNNGFKNARARADIDVRVQDLRHTFGHRLREAGVDEETRAELLGHGKSLTTHYSAASIQKLIEAAELVTRQNNKRVVVTLDDYRKVAKESRQTPAAKKGKVVKGG